jgi:hypothetical protein
MRLRRFVLAGAALAAMGALALPVMAQNAPPAPKLSPAFERAILNEMAPATRAEVQKRAASGGNTVQGVIATMLLNDASMVKGNTGAVTVVAIDFVRGVVVVQTAPNQYQPVRFDPKTLKILT